MNTGDSARLEGASDVNSRREEKLEKKKSPTLPLPDWFPELSARLERLNQWERDIVSNLAAHPEDRITEKQTRSLEKIRGKLKAPRERLKIGGVPDPDRADKFQQEFLERMRKRGLT
jgi:hypothetical protein